MISNLEKIFFDTFEIKPDTSENAYFTGHYNEYPPITDRILLKLVCYCNNCLYFSTELSCNSIDSLKQGILIGLLDVMNSSIHVGRKQKVKQEIQELFKEKP